MKSTLIEDLKSLEYELSQIIRKETTKLKDNHDKVIAQLDEEMNYKLNKDLHEMESKLIQNVEYELNRKINLKINEISRNIILSKNHIIQEFIDLVVEQIKRKVALKTESYFEFLTERLRKTAKLIQEPTWIFLNKNDHQTLKKNPNLLKIDSKYLNINEKPIDILCGYKLIAQNNTFEIDDTLDSRLDSIKEEISSRLMNLFPQFEFKMDNAIETLEKIKSLKNTNK